MEPRQVTQSNNTRVPATPGPYRHYMPVQIRFTDIDMLGHMNNAVFLTFFDMGKTRYFEEAMGEPVDWQHMVMVIVNLNCDFFSPVYFDSHVEVFTTVTRIGSRSVTMDQRLVNSDTGETHAMCITTLAGFDVKTASGAELPDEWVARIEKFENRTLRTR